MRMNISSHHKTKFQKLKSIIPRKQQNHQYHHFFELPNTATPQFKLCSKFNRIHLIIIFCILIFIYLIDFTAIGNFLYVDLEYYDNDKSNRNNENFIKNEEYAYLINTIGCKIPKFPVFDENIKIFLRDPEKITCEIPLTYSDNKYLWFNTNISDNDLKRYYDINNINDLICFYQPFRRLTDEKNEPYDDFHILNLYKKTRIYDEFIRVVCDYQNISKIYRDYHFFVPSKYDNNNNNDNDNKLNRVADENNLNNNNKRKYNVLIIGLDSLSRLNFQRQMKNSYDFIINKLKAIELLGYNKVGDNTFPNLVPALTGFDEKELTDTCLLPNPKETPFDNCHFIWKTYAENNYTTAFGEDIGYLGLFNYFRKGFTKQPTDYYPRPVFLELEKHIAKNLKLNIYQCLGGRRPIDIFFSYIKKFLHTTFNDKLPFFSFFWTSSMTHDYFTSAKLIDDDLKNLLENFYINNYLNNTILILMSDHGIRWGEFRNTYQGMMEERQPFLFISLPNNFYNQFPLAVKNLKLNQKHLTTHFDLYETLKDLVNVSSLIETSLNVRMEELKIADPLSKSISLFLPIPKTRTCEIAGIESHWCTCNEKYEISKKDIKVQIAARFIVKSINLLLKDYPQCQKLFLMSIKSASIFRTNTAITKNISSKNFYDITVHIKVKGSLAEFEGTVRLDSNNNVTALTGSISRINLYGKQSYCVDDYFIKLYCYCGL